MTAVRPLLASIVLVVALLASACVPESDLERASGGGNSADAASELALTPIPEDGLPELPDLQLRVLSIEIERGGNRVSAMISLGAGTDDRVEIAGTGKVEWSDGESSDAIPWPGGDMVLETRRTDRSGELTPETLYLTNISWNAGTDPEAEINSDAIVTQWGTFPVLSIESASRPSGFRLTYQAAGQRWISSAEVRRDGRPYLGEGSSGPFDTGFRPVTGSLRFGPEFEDLSGDLPLPAVVDIRMAIPEVRIDLR